MPIGVIVGKLFSYGLFTLKGSVFQMSLPFKREYRATNRHYKPLKRAAMSQIDTVDITGLLRSKRLRPSVINNVFNNIS